MRCVFVAIGWENIALQALSAVLKKHNHEVHLVYDQALFDDKNYLCIKWLARLFDQKSLVLQRIIELEPELVGFHVQTVQYQEMRELAKNLKKYYKVPVVFGGIHAHSAPEQVLLPDDPSVDIVCLGDGEYPILELCNSIDGGKIDYKIKNLWYRLEDGTIIKNESRPIINDIDSLPTIDKELFKQHVPMQFSYLTSPSRGCPFYCSYCSLSFLGDEARRLGGFRIRERTVNSLIQEIKFHVARYKPKWIDFRQPVMSVSKNWTVEFFKKYKQEINLPFHCFSHPLLISEYAVRAMKEAGCFAIQIGIECWDEEIRNKVINRRESNDDIKSATEILERVGQYYAFDYILGLPRLLKNKPDGTKEKMDEEEIMESYKKELFAFAEFIAPLRYCYRIAPFMVQYMPGTNLIKHGLDAGELSLNEVKRLNEGKHDNFMSSGSIIIKPRRLRLLNGYRVMLRFMSFLPPWAKVLMLKLRVYKIFWIMPFSILIRIMDLMVVVRDKDARTYMKNYLWWLGKRLDPEYHLYVLKKNKRREELQDGPFQLKKDGLLGRKMIYGWEQKSERRESILQHSKRDKIL